MWLRRGQWRDDSLIYLLFAQFLLVTAIYFGQTNHRVYLDVYLIVFAAGAIAAISARQGMMTAISEPRVGIRGGKCRGFDIGE